jgi:hypothetical protein
MVRQRTISEGALADPISTIIQPTLGREARAANSE